MRVLGTVEYYRSVHEVNMRRRTYVAQYTQSPFLSKRLKFGIVVTVGVQNRCKVNTEEDACAACAASRTA